MKVQELSLAELISGLQAIDEKFQSGHYGMNISLLTEQGHTLWAARQLVREAKHRLAETETDGMRFQYLVERLRNTPGGLSLYEDLMKEAMPHYPETAVAVKTSPPQKKTAAQVMAEKLDAEMADLNQGKLGMNEKVKMAQQHIQLVEITKMLFQETGTIPPPGDLIEFDWDSMKDGWDDV